MDIKKKVYDFVSKSYNHDEYNWLHNEFVTTTAIKLGRKLRADLEIIEIAARLHDIDYSRGKEFHTQDSAELAEKFLLKNKYPKEKVQKVKLAIMCHTSKIIKEIKNPSREGKILHDADKMWTMTPKGFARTIAHRYQKNKSYEYMKECLKKQVSSYNKLFFKESKQIIKKELEISKRFFEKLN